MPCKRWRVHSYFHQHNFYWNTSRTRLPQRGEELLHCTLGFGSCAAQAWPLGGQAARRLQAAWPAEADIAASGTHGGIQEQGYSPSLCGSPCLRK